MTDHNSPEAVLSRKNQEDPIVMYLIVRESLLPLMSVGKIAAQAGHAVGMLDRKYDEIIFEIESKWDPIYGPSEEDFKNIPQETKKNTDIWYEWNETSFRKVVLKADDKEWEKLKALTEVLKIVVVDAGLTEIPPGSETFIGLWPMRKSEAPKIVKKLQVLK